MEETLSEKIAGKVIDIVPISELSKGVQLLGVALGFLHGLCDSKGIPITKEHLEFIMTYGAAISNGALGGLAGYVVNKTCPYRLDKGQAVFGTFMEAAVGGLATAFGYGFGYLCGHFSK
ncbi:hypothetical protein HZA33_05330 [Candidatus Pacearchaeota archaeon]|nr:hypothetical protein [Candidatus Pacearchaeota archaeon]